MAFEVTRKIEALELSVGYLEIMQDANFLYILNSRKNAREGPKPINVADMEAKLNQITAVDDLGRKIRNRPAKRTAPSARSRSRPAKRPDHRNLSISAL